MKTLKDLVLEELKKHKEFEARLKELLLEIDDILLSLERGNPYIIQDSDGKSYICAGDLRFCVDYFTRTIFIGSDGYCIEDFRQKVAIPLAIHFSSDFKNKVQIDGE